MSPGFALRSEVLKAVVRRYGGRDGVIKEDDFIQSLCKIMTLYCELRAIHYHLGLLKSRVFMLLFIFTMHKNMCITQIVLA